MKSIISWTLFFFTSILLIVYIMNSSYIHKEAIEKELILTESMKTFLDTVSDKGALSARDYSVLVNDLGRTGASYKITVTTERLYDIPDKNNGFVKDYRPLGAYSSDIGNFPFGNPNDSKYIPTIYFRKFDIVTLNVQQTTMMTYQANQIRQFSTIPVMRMWNFSRGVRSDGNSIVSNEEPNIDYDKN